jgi:hypothetical protein
MPCDAGYEPANAAQAAEALMVRVREVEKERSCSFSEAWEWVRRTEPGLFACSEEASEAEREGKAAPHFSFADDPERFKGPPPKRVHVMPCDAD